MRSNQVSSLRHGKGLVLGCSEMDPSHVGEHDPSDINAENDALCSLHYMLEAPVLGIPVRDLEGAIHEAYRQDPRLVGEKDDRGFTPLHAAAHSGNLLAIQTLLALPSF
ncbi:hypothetical protein BN946_scf184392.g8 [Trametes cinnabarina]|uniref:Uncharacterized protein n=1 Tax=Pycnoporus cinnabarinus TaxID=5643 RepID=A0A060SIS2_PYCCI|nr:hypothetical protein BN946_scf184392.g8 [Trametes cinnabarina]